MPAALLLFFACTGAAPDSGAPDQQGLPEASRDLDRDVVHMDLAVDLSDLSATAVITLAAKDGDGATLEVGDLDIASVRWQEQELDWTAADGLLDIGLPAGETTLTVDYRFSTHRSYDGYYESRGFTLTWPYWCGNIFPCHSPPSDGLTWTLQVANPPDDMVVVAYDVTATEAPAYMLAWTLGSYTETELGRTSAGTRIVGWIAPDSEAGTERVADDLVTGFDWLEQSLGPYPYGDTAGTVAANWGSVAGAMEHHPVWHTSQPSAGDLFVQLHEAAHGWFGNGVRLACWEDVTLSEGVAEYLAARMVTDLQGAEAGDAAWAAIRERLEDAVATDDHPARPAGCYETDPLEFMDRIVYSKGAFFLKAVEAQVGSAALDEALATFHQAHVGQAAGVADLVATLQDETGFDVDPLAQAWLYEPGIPGPELGGW